MGLATGNSYRFIRSTQRSSEFYGVCELCGKWVSEVFVSTLKAEYQRKNGETYYSQVSGGICGHASCLNSQFVHKELIN